MIKNGVKKWRHVATIIKGAVMLSRIWIIPEKAGKPGDSLLYLPIYAGAAWPVHIFPAFRLFFP